MSLALAGLVAPAQADDVASLTKQLGAFLLACKVEGLAPRIIVYYRKTLDLEPRNGMAHFYLGVALSLQGFKSEAEEHFKQAVEIDPGYTEEIQAFLSKAKTVLN